jgi:lysine/ornithine N-monooxygenase
MKLSNNMSDDKFNYLDMDKKQFTFNNYKTQGKYNSVVVPIENELMKVISLYISNHPEKSKLKNKTYNIHFLKYFYNEDIIKSQEITRLLNKIFGKSIGSSLLRNIYLSNKYSGMVNQLKNDVKDMETSVDVVFKYSGKLKYESGLFNKF